MSEGMQRKLKIGFTFSRWGLDTCCAGGVCALVMIIMGVLKKTITVTGLLTAGGIAAAGVLLFGIGRVIVGLESNKLFRVTDRKRTAQEEWFLQMMGQVEKNAGGANLAMQAAKLIPGNTQEYVAASAVGGIIGMYFRVGKIYMPKNILIRRGGLWIGIVAAGFLLIRLI